MYVFDNFRAFFIIFSGRNTQQFVDIPAGWGVTDLAVASDSAASVGVEQPTVGVEQPTVL